MSGAIPTWSKSCRESPKILGIANSFAAGVFLAIAFVHILPEEAGNWAELNPDNPEPFPLPYFLMFCGYTLILISDKVMFDTHALFEHGHNEVLIDPVDRKLAASIKKSFAQIAQAERAGSVVDVRKSIANANTDIKQSFKEYLSSTDRFSARLKASMKQN